MEKENTEELKESSSYSFKFKMYTIIIYIVFAISLAIGITITTYMTETINYSIDYKVEKGEMLKYNPNTAYKN